MSPPGGEKWAVLMGVCCVRDTTGADEAAIRNQTGEEERKHLLELKVPVPVKAEW